jgi:hypothetical protein
MEEFCDIRWLISIDYGLDHLRPILTYAMNKRPYLTLDRAENIVHLREVGNLDPGINGIWKSQAELNLCEFADLPVH